jgi:hypothetical protein
MWSSAGVCLHLSIILAAGRAALALGKPEHSPSPAAIMVAAGTAPLPQLAGYFVHDHSIGPESQQRDPKHVLRCESSATCPREAAAACNASRAGTGRFPFVCRSFAVLKMGSGKEAQLYSTDYNESYYVPRWSMWSLSDGPAHQPRPAPSPPPLPHHGSESGREDYCAAKQLAFSYAAKMLAKVGAADSTTKLRKVSDALQLETACKTPFAVPPAADAAAQRNQVETAGRHHRTNATTVIYIDPVAGVDEDEAGAVDRPMRSMEAALARLRALRSKASTEGGGGSSAAAVKPAELVLRAGVHFTAQTIELTAVDSYLTIRGDGGDEPVVLSAGSPLTLEWQPVAGRRGVFSSAVPSNLSEFASLYVAGRRAVRSRSPDANPETMGLHTPNQTGYFQPSAARANGTLRQQCGPELPAGLCPVVAGPAWQPGSVFTYGHFTGAADKSVGYSPPFEPYWCGKWSGLSAITYDLEETATARALLPDGPSDAVLHMTRGTADIWANFQWNVTAHDLSEKRISLGKGGWQFPRGTTNGHWFIDNAGIAALTAAGEWYHDRQAHVLYMVGNGTAPPPTDVIVSQRSVALRQRGTAGKPIRGVVLHDLTVAHAEVTYTLPYETPSGGGYSVHRGEDLVPKQMSPLFPGGMLDLNLIVYLVLDRWVGRDRRRRGCSSEERHIRLAWGEWAVVVRVCAKGVDRAE